MPFFKPFLGKSKEVNQKKNSSSNDENGASSEKELLMQVGHLQLEMSRLYQQLASVQSHSHVGIGKEDLSTQKSHQTFSTKGTTQPNHSSVSVLRQGDRIECSPLLKTVKHVPHGACHSRDCPPPVSQIFIPTPVIANGRIEPFERSHFNGNSDLRTPPHGVKTGNMDKRNRSTHVDSKKNYQGWQQNGKSDRRTPPHAVKTKNVDKQNLSSRTEEGEDLQAWQQYARSPGMPVDVMPEKRPKTRSYRSHHSTPSNHSRESSNSFGRIRFRTVKRIPTETPSNANLSPSRRPATAQQEVSHTHQLARDTEDFNRRIIAVMEQTYSKKNGQDVRPSSCKRKGKPREVWPQTRESEVYKLPFNDETHYYSKPSDICEGRNVLYEQQRTRSNEKYKVKQVPKSKHDVRASSDEAARIISSNQCSRPKNSNQDKKILLSQIRKQRFNLKSASERPENPQLPKSNNEMDMMFAAIQNGVVLKHIEVPTKNSNQNQKSPTTALLAQLQERKKAYMRLEGTN